MNAKAEDFIVTKDDVKTAGAISYWRLSGDTRLAALEAAWRAEGLDEKLLPSEPSPEVALRRSVGAQESSTRRSFKIKGGDFAGGWGLVEVDTSGGHVQTYELLRARWDAGNQRIDIDTNHHGLNTEVLNRFPVERASLAPADISSWLIKLANGKSATSLRDSGGIYFVPRGHVDFWRSVGRAVEQCGHKVFKIPALHNTEAVEAILDAITTEANAEVEAIEADLEKIGDEAPGKRALDSRATRCRDLLKKVAEYETLLGVRLPEIQARVEDLSSAVATAALVREGALSNAA
jgi:hypothetical protein